MFTFQRTGNPAAPGGSRSSGSQRKSTPRKPSKSFTGANSVDAICGLISRKTGPGLRVSVVISAALRLTVTVAAATRVVAISIVVEVTTAAVVAAATVARSIGRRSPKAVGEGCAAKSEACSDVLLAACCASRAPPQLG